MTNYRATHVREREDIALEAAVREAMQEIRDRGGRIVDLKVAPRTPASAAHAIVLYEIEDNAVANA